MQTEGWSFERDLEGDYESGIERLSPADDDQFVHDFQGHHDLNGPHGKNRLIRYSDLKYSQWAQTGWTRSSE